MSGLGTARGQGKSPGRLAAPSGGFTFRFWEMGLALRIRGPHWIEPYPTVMGLVSESLLVPEESVCVCVSKQTSRGERDFVCHWLCS